MSLIRTSCFFAALVVVSHMSETSAQAQSQGKDNHGHMSENGGVCVDAKPGEKLEGFGCWNIASREVSKFPTAPLYWNLAKFPTKEAAESAKGATDLVVETEGQIWLFSFGPKDAAPKQGEKIATIGPLKMISAKSYGIVVSFTILPPGAKSVTHTHPGPEAWYMLAGEQSLETPEGARKARAGESMMAPPNTPMKLTIIGTVVRRSLVVVIHDASQPRSIPTNEWKPSGACER
jgi:quercetin dioxygenase-like cupin family protein